VPGLQIVKGSTVTVNIGGFKAATATCPAGKKLTGGGYETVGGAPTLDVYRSWPSADDTWTADAAYVSGGNGRQFRVYAICATPAP